MPGGSRRAGRRPDKDGDTEGDHHGGCRDKQGFLEATVEYALTWRVSA